MYEATLKKNQAKTRYKKAIRTVRRQDEKKRTTNDRNGGFYLDVVLQEGRKKISLKRNQ